MHHIFDAYSIFVSHQYGMPYPSIVIAFLDTFLSTSPAPSPLQRPPATSTWPSGHVLSPNGFQHTKPTNPGPISQIHAYQMKNMIWVCQCFRQKYHQINCFLGLIRQDMHMPLKTTFFSALIDLNSPFFAFGNPKMWRFTT